MHVVDAAAAAPNNDDHSNDLHHSVEVDLSSTASGFTASTESLPRRTSSIAFWSSATLPTTTAASPLATSTTSAIASPNTKQSPTTYVGSVAPTLDPEMRESVSILESDINKTIENNDKKLKEEQLKIERILQQKGLTGVVMATSSERSSYDLGVDFVTPIMEMVPEDERIEVIQTGAPIEFNFGETNHTPPPVVIAIDDGVDLKEMPTEGRNGKVRRVPYLTVSPSPSKSVAPELIFPPSTTTTTHFSCVDLYHTPPVDVVALYIVMLSRRGKHKEF